MNSEIELNELNGARPLATRLTSKSKSKIPECCIKRIACCAGVLGVVGLLCVAGGLTLLLTFRHILEYFVSKFLILQPNTELYSLWKEPPLPIFMSVYLFNITNKHEFPWNNTKPTVQQIGPYVFREFWNRTDVKWYDNGTLSYTKIKTFKMDEELTVGSFDDVVTTLNVPAVAVGKLFKTSGPLVKMMLSSLLKFLHETVFVTKKVREMLFEGYEDPLINMAKKILGSYPYDKFGYFYGRNGSTQEQYNIYTGAMHSDKFTVIEKFRNMTKMHAWESDECNQIRGTDGSANPPFLTENRILEIFASDLCRVITLGFKGISSFHGLPAYSFEFRKENFDNGTLDPANKCYCPDGVCLKSGALNMSKCLFGAPLALSMPHFFDADPSYLETVNGLQPNSSLHQSYFFLEPVSAFPMKMSGKFQINAMIERIPNFAFFDKLPTMLFPLVWFEERGEMSKEIVNQFEDQLYKPGYFVRIFAYTCVGVGATLGVLAVMYFVVARKQKTGGSHKLNNGNQKC